MIKARSVSFLVLLVAFVTSAVASAELQRIAYYGADFYNSEKDGIHNEDLKTALKKVLRSGHVKQANDLDQIVESCDSKSNCYTHTTYGYDRARQFLFGSFYLVKGDSGYGIQEMYCDRIYEGADFRGGTLPGPGVVPENNIINVEHTWPQSKFTGKFSKEMQKSDLHHLFPTDSKLNSIRGNTIFGEVRNDTQKTSCRASKFGSGTAGSRQIFEPPQHHKGRVARALFYFSVQYNMPISSEEEVVMKKWNSENPVDETERLRNDEIFKVQGNRNPFVDYPELANRITDF